MLKNRVLMAEGLSGTFVRKDKKKLSFSRPEEAKIERLALKSQKFRRQPAAK